jgi:DNA-binding CsgD family transcriptional regulator
MFEGLTKLIGCIAAGGGEGIWRSPDGRPQPMTAFDVGFDATARSYFLAYMRDHRFAADPLLKTQTTAPKTVEVWTRREVMNDVQWYKSAIYNEYRKPGGIDDQLTSVCRVGDKDAISSITLHRCPKERPFSAREQSILTLFHEELGRLIGGALVSGLEPQPQGLSPRLRQTLTCLIEGNSEKQAAARLGVSYATAHQYVTALYRFFSVRSRGELMSLVMKRLGSGSWKEFSK